VDYRELETKSDPVGTYDLERTGDANENGIVETVYAVLFCTHIYYIIST